MTFSIQIPIFHLCYLKVETYKAECFYRSLISFDQMNIAHYRPNMTGNMVPWDQSPEFLAATSTTILPGGPTAYSEIPYLGDSLSSMTDHIIALPRRTGNSAQDVTSFHPGHVSWSKHNMPNIIYVLRPSNEWYSFSTSSLPAQKVYRGHLVYVGADGRVVYTKDENPRGDYQRLLDFKILPGKVRFLAKRFVNLSNPSCCSDWHV